MRMKQNILSAKKTKFKNEQDQIYVKDIKTLKKSMKDKKC